MVEQPDRASNYRSFWLRCWQISGGTTPAQSSWRFSLEDPRSGVKRGFDELSALVGYLEEELKRHHAEEHDA